MKFMTCSVPGCEAMPFKFTTDGSGDPTTATATANAYTVAYSAGVYTISPNKKYVGLDGASFLIDEGRTKLSVEPTSDSLNQDSGYAKFTVFDCNMARSLAAPDAAAADAVHASVAASAAAGSFTSISHPDVPRNVTATFAAGWDGGDITVTGTNQFDEAQTEVIADTAGSTVAGVKIFKTVTAIEKESVGASGDGVTIGSGLKIGIPARIDSTIGLLMCDGVAEVGTFDSTYSAVTTTTAPNGSKVFTVLIDSKVEAPIISGNVTGCLFLNTTGTRSEP